MKGHTASYGISCTTEFDYAFGWNKASVYVIDLSRHPFAVDISQTVRDREKTPHAKQFDNFIKKENVIHNDPDVIDLGDDFQFEINVANRIAAEQIIGCYRGLERIFYKNPNYDQDYGA